ncbi:MAG: hypothetical protein IJT87_12220 [Ruminiclostridium sp.]|nr:hypothetical protein [Ruminiclostridium sp.]
MKFERALAILGACAVILTAAGCKSPDVTDNTLPAASGNVDTTAATAADTEIAAETSGDLTVPAVETTFAAHEPTDTTAETSLAEITSITEINGEEYVIGYTSSQEQTTTPAETTTTAAETTVAPEAADSAAKPDFLLRINNDGYITTETKAVAMGIEYTGGAGGKIYTTGERYTLEKKEGGKWRAIPFAEDVWIEIAYEISSESHHVPFTIDLEDDFYKEPITAGRYRVVKEISGVKYGVEFDIIDAPAPAVEDEISMRIESDGEITSETDSITLYLEYTGKSDSVKYTVGLSDYRLQKYENGKWTDIEFPDNVVSGEPACYYGLELCKDYPSEKFIVPLIGYKQPVTAGKYRVIKRIGGAGGVDITKEFTVVEAAPSGKKSMISENGYETLDICEIKPDEFVCCNYIPLPGTYHIVCDTSKYPDYCVGDRIDVYGLIYTYSDDEYDNIYIEPTDIEPSSAQLDPDVEYKPVLYLYPESTTDVTVKLDYNGSLIVTDPEYGNGWTVTADPDGMLIYEGREYPYLFWEGKRDYELTLDKGFCVSGADTERFLRGKLAFLGLNDNEIADFLEFWLPYMKDNAFNVISFAGSEYTDNAKYDITPSPDTVIRVYMQFMASDTPVDIPEQELAPAPARSGFTVVEWGGSVRK